MDDVAARFLPQPVAAGPEAVALDTPGQALRKANLLAWRNLDLRGLNLTAEKLEGTLADGAFWLTGAGGQALPATLTGAIDALYDFISNETATPIITP